MWREIPSSPSSVVVMAGSQKSAAFFFLHCMQTTLGPCCPELTHTHARRRTLPSPGSSAPHAYTLPPQRRRFSARSQTHQSNAIGLKHKWTRHCFCWRNLLTPTSPPLLLLVQGSLLEVGPPSPPNDDDDDDDKEAHNNDAVHNEC